MLLNEYISHVQVRPGSKYTTSSAPQSLAHPRHVASPCTENSATHPQRNNPTNHNTHDFWPPSHPFPSLTDPPDHEECTVHSKARLTSTKILDQQKLTTPPLLLANATNTSVLRLGMAKKNFL
ncbi:hypothetical protein L211DRAFT_640174 [Terfezia boudieri ATCC MYA-4762]|uniref:Uncharacterized protein n=1 Tax=Terfezia boudieri ATCC MYA-4762 TaxID=1051890 RepID=A0A3N4L8S2_9PEZI|nr:hypothetical protein L211DRAFT_640174 [Terfezia boudieri ATCC MYA-4762]